MSDDIHDLDALFDQANARITFADVGGMEDAKQRINMAIVYPFKHAATFQRFRRRAGGGILLYGPPGCGKTHLARAAAGECGARFIAIGITDVLSGYIGDSEIRLHTLFESARRLSPAVIFIDELDALGMRRSDARGTALASIVNQLLIEMDGVQDANRDILILAATNAPWAVDSAFRRPGRFDHIILVPPPDDDARAVILEIFLRDLPHEPPDMPRLVRATSGFSGADIRALVDRAGEAAIAEEMRTGKPGLIARAMLLDAARVIRPSTLEWMATARNYASYGNQGGQYDELVRFFQEHR